MLRYPRVLSSSDPLERGPRVVVTRRNGTVGEEPVLDRDGDAVCLGGHGGYEVVILDGEGGLPGETATVDVEEERELGGGARWCGGGPGEEEAGGDGRVGGYSDVLGADPGGRVLGRRGLLDGREEEFEGAILVDVEEAELADDLAVCGGHSRRASRSGQMDRTGGISTDD